MLCLVYLKQELLKENFTLLLLTLAALATSAVKPVPNDTPALETLKKILRGFRGVCLCKHTPFCSVTKCSVQHSDSVAELGKNTETLNTVHFVCIGLFLPFVFFRLRELY